MKPTLVILAAGMGSRYGSLKQVDPVGPSGETILEYSVFDAIRAGFGKVVFVIRRDIENDFKEIFINKLRKYIEVEYVFQELDMVPAGIQVPAERVKPWGTGHAVMVAASKVNEPFAVINADDYYGSDAYKKIADYLSQLDNNQADFSMVGFDLDNTLSEHGLVSRGVCDVDAASDLISVTERTQIGRDEKGVAYKDENGQPVYISDKSIVSMNFWGFTPLFFKKLDAEFQSFIKGNYTNPKAEFFLPFVVDDLIKSKQATVKVLRSTDRWFGVTYKEDKPMVVSKIKELVEAGVYPSVLWE
ncbi:MAG: nucleotidyltransferase [Bacteroidota bacterium]|nr:nucleotidyltransferase [Bacteroidota bacterium]